MYCVSYLIGRFIPRLSVSRVVQLTSATSMTLHTSMFFLLWYQSPPKVTPALHIDAYSEVQSSITRQKKKYKAHYTNNKK